MIIFETETELDMLALRTMGLSAKESETAIGRFGTGLKYALAVLAREGCEVTIHSGATRLKIDKETREFRERQFDFVVATPESEPPFDLGFTTILGQDWELWQAFREIYSNTLDENGETRRATAIPAAKEGRTVIAVAGVAFEEVFEERGAIVITDKPLWENSQVAIHEGESEYMFYQGIRARKLERPSAFRYNIKYPIGLTEDRTIKHPWWADDIVRDGLAECTAPEVVKRALGGSMEGLERRLNYIEAKETGETFARVVTELRAKDEKSVPASAVMAVAKAVRPEDPSNSPAAVLSEEHSARLLRVCDLLRTIGISASDAKIIAVGLLPGDARHVAKGNRLYLADKAFETDETLTAAIVTGLSQFHGYSADSWLRGHLLTALQSLTALRRELNEMEAV